MAWDLLEGATARPTNATREDGSGGLLSPRPSRPRPSRPLPPALAPRAAAQAAKAERRHAMEMIADRAPYRTMGASVDFFDGYVPVRPALQPTPLLRPY